MTKKHQLDLLPVITPSTERREYLRFTRPYINYSRAILTRNDYPFITGLADLDGKRVAMVAGYYQQDLLDGGDRVEILPVASTLAGLKALSAGQVEAFLGDTITSAYAIRKYNLTNLKYAATTAAKSPGFALGIRADWPELVPILDKALASISEEEHRTIFNKWVSLRFEKTFDYSLLVEIVIFFSVALALMLWWNSMIQRQKTLIQAAKDAAEAANRTKSVFLASMSHELRTPLNSILGFNGIILNEMAGPLNFEQKKQLKMVQGSARHLLNLINDVLDISKIEAGELELSQTLFNMADLVEQTRAELLPLAEKKLLTLTAEIAPEVGEVLSDERRIRQVLINLINNALKFTEKGGVHIRCRVDGDELEIRVSDTGIGIAQQDLDKLFRPFQQLDSGLARKFEGTGLGLSICKRIITAVGGRIWVESQVGKGSSFSFRLPLIKKQGDLKDVG
jgi:signal transduction histidine kinase